MCKSILEEQSKKKRKKAFDFLPWGDLFSLGVVFYECLTGEPPFDTSLPEEVLLAEVAFEKPIHPVQQRRAARAEQGGDEAAGEAAEGALPRRGRGGERLALVMLPVPLMGLDGASAVRYPATNWLDSPTAPSSSTALSNVTLVGREMA